MRVYVTTIPFTGMKINAPISLESLNSRLKGGSESAEVSFTEGPLADLTLTRTQGGVIIKGIISGPCLQDCSTCADPVRHEVVATIGWLLQTKSDAAAPEDSIDDPAVLFYEGDHIDLEEPLQEALILALNPFWHPARDSQDHCTVCKRDCSNRAWRAKDTESTSNFGSLLKNALGK